MSKESWKCFGVRTEAAAPWWRTCRLGFLLDWFLALARHLLSHSISGTSSFVLHSSLFFEYRPVKLIRLLQSFFIIIIFFLVLLLKYIYHFTLQFLHFSRKKFTFIFFCLVYDVVGKKENACIIHKIYS